MVGVLLNVNAQDDASATSTSDNFNELKLNALYAVVGVLDLTYERTLNEESGIGLTFAVPFDKELDSDINYYVSPYYRFYFGKKYAAGFFLEGFGMLSAYEQTDIFIGNDVVINEESKLAFALGIGVGGKWVTNGGFIGELSLGVGRNIINADDFIDDVVGKISIGIGYRF